MSVKTLTMTKEEMFAFKAKLSTAQVRKTPPYAYYQLKTPDCVITAYTSGKIVFQGVGADAYVDLLAPQKNVSTNISYPQCGSDEVGTGDYFGPVVVCAAFVKEEDVSDLKKLNIQDSKAIDDTTIRTLAHTLIKQLPHSLLILDNAKYNQIHATNNMVAMKAKLHNQAYVHLKHKLGSLPSFCVVDQFVQAASYYRYIQTEKEIVRNLHFETKAENKYLAVACASIIARYAFLKTFDAMEKHYDFHFLKGAGSKVDANIREFVNHFGKEELRNVAKLHFANTKKALDE